MGLNRNGWCSPLWWIMLEPAKRPPFPTSVSNIQFLAKTPQKNSFLKKKINKNSLFQKKFLLHFSTFKYQWYWPYALRRIILLENVSISETCRNECHGWDGPMFYMKIAVWKIFLLRTLRSHLCIWYEKGLQYWLSVSKHNPLASDGKNK